MEKAYINNINNKESLRIYLEQLSATIINTNQLKAKFLYLKNKLTFDDDSFLNKIFDQIDSYIINITTEVLSSTNENICIPIGTILSYAGKEVPYGWLECNGEDIDKAKYEKLYSLLGTKVPNLRFRYLMGASDHNVMSNNNEKVKTYLFNWDNLPPKNIDTNVWYNYSTDTNINTNDDDGYCWYLVNYSRPGRPEKYRDENVHASVEIGGNNSILLEPDYINLKFIIKAL